MLRIGLRCPSHHFLPSCQSSPLISPRVPKVHYLCPRFCAPLPPCQMSAHVVAHAVLDPNWEQGQAKTQRAVCEISLFVCLIHHFFVHDLIDLFYFITPLLSCSVQDLRVLRFEISYVSFTISIKSHILVLFCVISQPRISGGGPRLKSIVSYAF